MDKRSLIAFLLVTVVMLVWMHREQRKAEEVRRYNEWKRQQAAALVKEAEGEAQSKEGPAGAAAMEAIARAAEIKDSATGGPDAFSSAVWSNRGACLVSLRLSKYDETAAPAVRGQGLGLLLAPEETSPLAAALPATLLLRDPNGRYPLDTHVYDVAEQPGSEPGGHKLVYTGKLPSGLRVVKTIETFPGSYVAKFAVEFANQSDHAIPVLQYEIVAASRVLPRSDSNDASERLITGCYALKSGSRVRYTHMDATSVLGRKDPCFSNAGADSQLVAVGSANHYFAAVLMPRPQPGQEPWARDVRLFGVDKADLAPDGQTRTANLSASIVTRPVNLAPGESVVHQYDFYAGPKDPAVVKQYPALDGLINYGWFLFNPISEILNSVLRMARGVTGSYGLAIMLLTLVVKLALFPLTRKSQITMHKMKQIQPFINDLREKYKHDRERLAREQMQLMRQHGANPLTGCLPIFFQIPVFIGLFNMIRNAITLRHQSFLWMRDLSSPDTIGHLAGFPINIMPVLMTITWFVQQLTMPKPDDPQQRATQKIMMITPIIFGFMLYNYASGLALYWFTSTLLAICEQKYIKWQIERHHSAPIIVGADSAPSAPVEAKPAAAGLDPRPRKRPGARRRR